MIERQGTKVNMRVEKALLPSEGSGTEPIVDGCEPLFSLRPLDSIGAMALTC